MAFGLYDKYFYSNYMNSERRSALGNAKYKDESINKIFDNKVLKMQTFFRLYTNGIILVGFTACAIFASLGCLDAALLILIGYIGICLIGGMFCTDYSMSKEGKQKRDAYFLMDIKKSRSFLKVATLRLEVKTTQILNENREKKQQLGILES